MNYIKCIIKNYTVKIDNYNLIHYKNVYFIKIYILVLISLEKYL